MYTHTHTRTDGRAGPNFQKTYINLIKTRWISIKTMLKTLEMSGASRCLNIIKIAWIGCAFVKKHLYVFISKYRSSCEINKFHKNRSRPIH